MKPYCDTLQKLLAQKGPSGIQNDLNAQEHLEGCTKCYEFLEALVEIDHQLHEIPLDLVSDEVVDKVIHKIRKLGVDTGKTESPESQKKESWINRFRSFRFSFPKLRLKRFGYALSVIIVLGVSTMWIAPKYIGSIQYAKRIKETMVTDEYDREDQVSMPAQKPRPKGRIAGKKQKPKSAAPMREYALETEKEEFSVTDRIEESEPQAPAESVEGEPETEESTSEFVSSEPPMLATKDKTIKSELKGIKKGIYFKKKSSLDIDEKRLPSQDLPIEKRRQRAVKREIFSGKSGEKLSQLRDDEFYFNDSSLYGFLPLKHDKDSPDGNLSDERLGFESSRTGSMDIGGARPPQKSVPAESGQNLLNQFLRERSSTENLTFKEAKGYWENTYVPGDPVFRWLNSRLINWDRTNLLKYVNTRIQLDTAARQNTQPFDPPDNAALGVYLHTDKAAINGKNRLLIQVGLQGTQRYSGSRSAMNVGIVLDLRGSRSVESRKKIRALMEALSQAKDIGDRFSVTVAGKPGSMLVHPKNFKYGYLTVTLNNLFKEDTIQGKSLSLIQALKVAIKSVAQNDDPTSPLGSSEIILVTDQSLGALTNQVSSLAHQSALNGIPISAVGIGDRINIKEIDQIVLNGQGNRRLLTQAGDATGLVSRELSAASRVIARAVRLRIRLSSGVQLIDVLGSSRLDTADSQKVREAEKSIDLRMARNLGIKADRGEDEDGIQIVIPSFFAGDSHLILLDVLASGPGDIADVTVKYKDLVKLKNGVVRANLTLQRGKGLAGHLERNVIKNLIAYKLHKSLVQAGEALETGNDTSAIQLTENYLAFLKAVQGNLPGFVRDKDMLNDIQMLQGFLTVITGAAVQNQDHRMYISDSLKLAGHLKVLPRPANNN